MTFHGARPDADQLSGAWHRSASGNEGSEDVHLALRRWSRESAAQVPVSHALRAVAGEDSIGVRLIIRNRNDC